VSKFKPCPIDGERESRIEREVLQGEEGQSGGRQGWHRYLARAVAFPFSARWLSNRGGALLSVIRLSPLSANDWQLRAKVIDGQSSRELPLHELYPLEPEAPSMQAVLDWHYWVRRGRAFEGLQ
jgi:hypothetical protein